MRNSRRMCRQGTRALKLVFSNETINRYLRVWGSLALLLGLVVPSLAAAQPPTDTPPVLHDPISQVPVFTDVAGAMNAAAAGYGTAAAWGDYDSDGDQDLYVVNLGAPPGIGQANVLLRNDGSTFTDVTGQAGVGDTGPGVAAAWADLDNDGDLDLFVSNRPGSNALYQNQGDGTFENIAGPAGVGDSSGYGEGSAWADDDRDGLVDLYVANYTTASGTPNRLFRNLDGFHFTDVAAPRQVAHTGNGEGIAWADFDQDGDQDLYVTNAGGSNVLFQRQADGTFDDVTSSMHVPGGPGNSYGAAWGDYDGDGWLDLYVAQQGSNKLYRNLDGVDFADTTDEAGVGGSSWSLGCAWGDMDNDGRLDLHVANADVGSYDPADVLYRNLGGVPAIFTDVTGLAGISNTLDARGSAWGDYDGDGDLDLYVVNQGDAQPNRLFRNGGSTNHWLAVQLSGCGSNRSAIGARVQVSSDRTQVREISGGSGFASQDSLPADFGLGDWSAPVTITVHWPSGIEVSLSGVAPDCLISITEPCPDLSATAKGVSANVATPGEGLTYTLVLSNQGNWTAPARLTDTLPLSLTWADALTATLGVPAWDPLERNVLWSGPISAGVALTISYRVTVNPDLVCGTLIPNLARVDDGYRPPFATAPVTVTVPPVYVAPDQVTLHYNPTDPWTHQRITFTAGASGTAPLTFTWGFGDGDHGEGMIVSHAYDLPGTYTVVLTAANVCGEKATSATLTIQPCDPVTGTLLAWEPLSPTVNQPVSYFASATGTLPLSFTWAFGDGSAGTGVSTTHVYTLPGRYVLSLTAANRCGQERVSETIEVEPCQAPAGLGLSYRPQPAVAGQPSTFSATLEAGSKPLTFTWQFGDMTPPEAGAVLSHTYAQAGLYTIALTASNSCGSIQDSFSLKVMAPGTAFWIYLPLVQRSPSQD